MCTSVTERLSVEAHGKGEGKWSRLSSAAVYYDHPVRATSEHAVIVDLRNDDGPLSSRVVVEMSAASAAALVEAINRVLATAPAQGDLLTIASAPRGTEVT
jgi:hypothetical protein